MDIQPKVTKATLEHDMHVLKLSQREIAEKHNVSVMRIQTLQSKFKLQITNVMNEKVPRSVPEDLKKMILACVIGNAILTRDAAQEAKIKFIAPAKRTSYINSLYENMKPFVRTAPTSQISMFNGKATMTASFKTLSHDYFTYLHDLLYNDGRKHLSENLVAKIDLQTFAYLIAECGTKLRYFLDLNLSYPDEELSILRNRLSELGIQASVVHKRGRNVLRVSRKSMQAVSKLMEDFSQNIFK